MNSRTALMFALAVMLVVANMVQEDSQVSRMAEMDKGALRDRAAEVADMSGFSSDMEIGPQESIEDREGDDNGDRASASAALAIGDFSWDKADEAEDTDSIDRPSRLANAPDRDPEERDPDVEDLNFNPVIG